MPVDSDSAIAWHRAQLKKLRETLRNIEGTRFTVGELAQSTRSVPEERHRSRSPQFLAASFAFALQEIKKVKARALRAISAVFSSVLASEI